MGRKAGWVGKLSKQRFICVFSGWLLASLLGLCRLVLCLLVCLSVCLPAWLVGWSVGRSVGCLLSVAPELLFGVSCFHQSLYSSAFSIFLAWRQGFCPACLVHCLVGLLVLSRECGSEPRDFLKGSHQFDGIISYIKGSCQVSLPIAAASWLAGCLGCLVRCVGVFASGPAGLQPVPGRDALGGRGSSLSKSAPDLEQISGRSRRVLWRTGILDLNRFESRKGIWETTPTFKPKNQRGASRIWGYPSSFEHQGSAKPNPMLNPVLTHLHL